jgi:signal transduction histidine kinase
MGGGRDVDRPGQPRRDQTDESLRVEREKSDAAGAQKHETLEAEADEVVQLARERADQVVQDARDEADRERPQSTAAEGAGQRERSRADLVLRQERSSADALLENDRAERRRYLADFLAVERDATDKDLRGERANADKVIATRDDFLATVSHDLRSLLGGLSLNAELLVKHAPEGQAGDRIRKHAGTSQRLVARMNRLVNDLLDMASIEAGKLALVPTQVEVAHILRDTLEAFEPIAAAKRIRLGAGVEPVLLQTRIDADRILQVLANLVSNALKFTAPEGRVWIAAHSEKGEIHFAVSDTGIGIPQEELQGVFERFHQVSKDRRGLGLGLYISRCIVEVHGGRMWAESTLGAGSTFHVVLPAE